MTSPMDFTSPDSPRPDENLDLLVRSDDEIQKHKKKTKNHTSLVRWMRLVLPVIALSIVVILMVWSDSRAPLTPVPREQVSPQTISQNELIKPKFQSEDSHNRPYTITADKATQNAEDMNTVLLQKPVADMTFEKGGWVSLKATNGAYKQAEGDLDLDGQVEIHHDSGYELHTEKMAINVKGQSLSSDTAVTGHGPAADISASGLEANGTNDTVIFKGPAKLTLRQTPPNEAPSNEGKKETQ